METHAEIVTYWLCPAEPARTALSAIIRDLAARFDAPAFEPHVTLYVTNAGGENPDSVLAVAISRGEFRLAVRGLEHSHKFTKTLFIQFEPSDDVARLSEELRRASACQPDYELNPHLSLLYRKMDDETKQDLAGSIVLPFTDVIFDRVRAVISPGKIESREDVEAWQIVAEKRLRA